MRLRVFALAVMAAAAVCVAQDGSPGVRITPKKAPRQIARGAASLRVDVNVVLIPVTVTDPFGAPFRGLDRGAFRVFEDGVEQQLSYFASEEAPVSMGLIFDASRSMAGRLDQSRQAVSRLFRTAVPGDEFFLISFNDSPVLLSDFTTETDAIEKSLAGIQAEHWTALLDAVYFGLDRMKRAKNARRALVILSDGADNASRYTEAEMRALVRESDVCIYSIGFAGPLINPHLRLLRNVSEETGGRLYKVTTAGDLPGAVAAVSDAIRQQYVLGFCPTNDKRDGMYRKVEVKLNPRPGLPRLRASWRVGYYGAAGE